MTKGWKAPGSRKQAFPQTNLLSSSLILKTGTGINSVAQLRDFCLMSSLALSPLGQLDSECPGSYLPIFQGSPITPEPCFVLPMETVCGCHGSSGFFFFFFFGFCFFVELHVLVVFLISFCPLSLHSCSSLSLRELFWIFWYFIDFHLLRVSY